MIRMKYNSPFRNPVKNFTILDNISPIKLHGPRLTTSFKFGMVRAFTASSMPASALENRVATKNIGAASTPTYTIMKKID